MPLGGEVDVVSKGLVRLLDRSCVDPMQLLNRCTPASCDCMQQQPLRKFSQTWVQGQSAHVACCNHSYCSIHMSLSLCCDAGKDIFWYAKGKGDSGVTQEELQAVKAREREMMDEVSHSTATACMTASPSMCAWYNSPGCHSSNNMEVWMV